MRHPAPHRLAALALATACAAGLGAAPSFTHAGARRAHATVTKSDAVALRLERRAKRLVRQAARAMQSARPECVQAPRAPVTFTPEAPSELLRAALIILRRPPIPADGVPQQAFDLSRLAANGVYADWVRLARAADGREFYVVAAQHRNLPAPLSRSCLRDRHDQLVRLLDGARPELRREALRIETQVNQRDHPANGFPDGEVLSLFERGADGILRGGASSGTLETLRTRGILSSVEQPDYSSKVAGLLPDGVATVEAIYSQRVDRGPHRPPEIYPSDVRLIAPVQDNLVSFRVPRETPDALPTTMVWRGVDGEVLRTVRGSGPSPAPG